MDLMVIFYGVGVGKVAGADQVDAMGALCLPANCTIGVFGVEVCFIVPIVPNGFLIRASGSFH